MTRRGPRALTPEERRLWAAVARAAVPLLGRTLPILEEPETPPASRLPEPDPVARPDPRPPPKPTLPPLASLDRRTSRALSRGRTSADAILDLHGMTQSEAHAALIRFLRRSHERGHALILVVTGKGGRESDATGPTAWSERGVLRRMVPHWLSLPDLRPLVVGFEEAGTRQGGGGALYVRLRRRRG